MAKGKYLKKRPKPPFLLLFLGFLLIFGGAMVFLYPTISNLYAERHHATVIQSYSAAVEAIDAEKMDQAWEEAKIYNENLLGDPVHDPFVPGSGYVLPDNYNEVLNLDQDGVMGYILIPKISVQLPIYHGTGEDVLEKGVGHIEQTALPIGGEGCHSVLTGHRGLPSAVLFTRLDEMAVGDKFYISVLDEILAYEVQQVNTVLPYELENLAAVQGQDLITLVTCTPYGVNTHRLLVQGSRTEYEEADVEQDVSRVTLELQGMDIHSQTMGILIGLILLLVLILLLCKRRLGRKGHRD